MHSFQKFITLYVLKMFNSCVDFFIYYLNELQYSIWYLQPQLCKMTFVWVFSFYDHLYKWLSIYVKSTLFDCDRFFNRMLYTAKKNRHYSSGYNIVHNSKQISGLLCFCMMLMKFYFLAKVRILDLKILNAYDDILSLFDSNDVMKFFMYRTETPWLLSKHFR